MSALFGRGRRFCGFSKLLINFNRAVLLRKSGFCRFSDTGVEHSTTASTAAASCTTDEERRQQMGEIVRHMQELALLRDPTQEGAVEGEEHQVEYLLSEMNIADQLLKVNIDGVKPMHSLLENEVTYLRPDEPAVLSEDERCLTQSNSQNFKFGMYVAPPIPATEVSRKVTKELTDAENEDF